MLSYSREVAHYIIVCFPKSLIKTNYCPMLDTNKANPHLKKSIKTNKDGINE